MPVEDLPCLPGKPVNSRQQYHWLKARITEDEIGERGDAGCVPGGLF